MSKANKILVSSKDSEKFPIEVKSVFPKHRQEVLNLNGWGYKSSYFAYENGLKFKGDRYSFANAQFGKARQKLLELLKIDINEYKPYINPIHKESDYPPAIENPELVKALEENKIEFSTDFEDRFLRCRGQSPRDFYLLRYRKFQRIPDIVVWVKNHEEVVKVVELANKYMSVIIPYGGGTNVSLSLNYTKKENQRFFISLDTSLMNKILWIDKVSMVACIEAGIAGEDLENALAKENLTMGHQPDSVEFSTLGGWVATRSSGMKQITYGNIEDMVQKITLVTSVGVMEKNFTVPRVSIGPDFDHLAIGSEGTLGVITKVVVRVRKIPDVRRCGSIFFPDFEAGVKFMYDISQLNQKPSNIRLVDALHVNIGQAWHHNKNFMNSVLDFIKQNGVQWFLRYDLSKACMATYLIECEKEEADSIEKNMKDIGWKYWGISAGEKYGETAYLMTYTVGYIRDLFFDLGYLGDSMEPSVSWSKIWMVIHAIRSTWAEQMQKRNIEKSNYLGLRISQIYRDGACVYLYYAIGPTKEKDQLETFEELTDNLREAIVAAGGSISHHHGIGKKSSKFYPSAVSRVGVGVFHAIKREVDPNNVFDAGNMIEDKHGAKL